MSVNVGELVAKIGVDTSQLVSGMKTANESLASFGAKFETVASAVTDGTSRIENAIKTMGDGIGSGLRDVNSNLVNMTSTLGKIATESSTQTKAISSGFETLIKSSNDMAAAFRSDASAVRQGFETMDMATRQFGRDFRAMGKEIEDGLRATASATTALGQRFTAFRDGVTKSLGEVSTAMEKLARNFYSTAEDSVRSLSRVEYETKAVGLAVMEMTERVTTGTFSFKNLMADTRNGFSALDKAVRVSSMSIVRAIQNMNESMNAVSAKKLEEVANRLTAIEGKLRDVGRTSITMGNNYGHTVNNMGGFTEGLMGKLRMMTTDIFFLQMSLQQLQGLFSMVFGEGIAFATKMETSLIGIGAIISSSLMDKEGKDISFSEGMTMANIILKDMKQNALESTATLEELMDVFQAILGPATSLGMSMSEIEKFTMFGTTAVKAMGLNHAQLVQELRSIVSEGITTRGSTVATALGITNKDIEAAKSEVGGVFKFLQDRMKGFEAASKENANTLAGIFSNIKDGIQQVQEKAFSGIFLAMHDELMSVQDLFFKIERYAQDVYDENGKKTHSMGEIKTAQLNPQTVAFFKQIAMYTYSIYMDIKEWSTSLMQNDVFMARLHVYWASITNFVGTIYEHIDYIVKAVAIWYVSAGGVVRVILAILVYLDAIPPILDFISDHIEIIIGLFTAWQLLGTKLFGQIALLAVGFLAPTSSAGLFAKALASSITQASTLGATMGLVTATSSVGLAANAGKVGVLSSMFTTLKTTVTTVFSGILNTATTVIKAVSFGFMTMIFNLCEGFLEANNTAQMSLKAIGLRMIATIGIIGGVVYAVYLLVEALKEVRDVEQEVKDDLARRSGTGQISGMDGAMVPYADQEPEPPPAPKEKPLSKAEQRQKELDEKLQKLEEDMNAKMEEARRKMDETQQKFPADEKEDKGAKKAAAEELQREFKEIENEMKKHQDQIKTLQEQNEADYNDHLIGIEGYFSNKIRLEKQNLEWEKWAYEQKLAIEVDPSNIEKLQGQLDIVNQQLDNHEYEVKILKDKAKAYQELNKQLDAYKAEDLKVTDPVKAGLQEFDNKYDVLRKSLDADIKDLEKNEALTEEQKKQLAYEKEILASILKKRAATEAYLQAEKAITDFKLKQDTADLRMNNAKEQVEKDKKYGLIDEYEAQQKIYDIEKARAKELEDSESTYIENQKKFYDSQVAGNKITPEEAKLKLAQDVSSYEKNIESLKHPLTVIQEKIRDSLASSMADAFESIITGTKSVSSAFKDMAKSVLNSIAKIASQKLASSIASDLFPSLFKEKSYQGGVVDGKYLGGIVKSYSYGGAVFGDGTDKSDSIPTMLSNGEFVLRAAAVKRIGLANLNRMNQYGTLPPLKYSKGGVVGEVDSSKNSNSNSSSSLQNLKIEVINNTGTDAKVVKTETKVDGVQTVISLWLEGVSKNVGGSKDMLKQLGGRA